MAALALVPSPAEAAFPGENGRISFVTYAIDQDAEFDYEIDTIRLDGAGRQAIANIPRPDSAPTWSPNGRSLVFSRYRQYGDLLSSQVFMVDAATGQVSHIINGRIDPSFDPSGEWITFSAGRRIESVRADGTGLHTAFRAPRRFRGIWHPRWSPNGKRIVVQAVARKTRKSRIWSFRSDGTRPRRITSGSQDAEPEYSPDGHRIIFNRRWSHLIIARADGTQARKLYSDTSKQGSVRGAVFAPAGDRVVFTTGWGDRYGSCSGVHTRLISDRSPRTLGGCAYPYDPEFPGWQPLPAGASAP